MPENEKEEIGFKFTGWIMYLCLILLAGWGILGWIGLFSLILGVWNGK